MDAVQPIIPFLAWIVLAFVGAVGVFMVGSVNRFVDNMGRWQERVEDKLDDHGNRIVKLEAK